MVERVQEEAIRKRKETLIFLIKLLALSIPLYLVLWLKLDMGFLQEVITRNVVSSLNLFGIEAKREGFTIILRDFFFVISKDCTGWKGMMFLSALVLSTRSSWRKKALGFAIHLPAFFSFNMMRIITMVWIGSGNKALFLTLHDIFWQVSMIGVVIILWLMWDKFGKT